MAEAVQRPIGTRDFAPAEMAVRRALEQRMRSTFHAYGYQEVGTPTFEDLALFTAKSGQGVLDELYHFKDKGERDLTLRPELTAPVMRLYFAEHFNDPKPLKWYYFGNCFRYDRPQAGRYREFWQFGCEQIGAGTPLAYAELVALASQVMRDAGVRALELRIGHVLILKHCVRAFGFDAATQGAMMRAIDKRNDAEIRRIAATKEGCEAAVDRLFLVMDAPSVAAAREALRDDLGDGRVGGAAAADGSAPGAARAMGLGREADAVDLGRELDELEQTLQHLRSFGVVDFRLDLGIARGLDYYTGIVFEMHCPLLGAQKQLLGGGGYDLSAVFAGPSTPTMGFGLGFDRTILALQEQSRQAAESPGNASPRAAVYFAALSPAALAALLPVVAHLREHGVACELDLMARKPGAVAKHAAAVGATSLVIIGERDLESGQVQVKRLDSGETLAVAISDLARHWLGSDAELQRPGTANPPIRRPGPALGAP